MNIDKNTLEVLSKQPYEEIDKAALVDIEHVKIDSTLPPGQRLLDYFRQIKNPYCFRCGTTTVRIGFTADGNSLDSILKNYYRPEKRLIFCQNVL